MYFLVGVVADALAFIFFFSVVQLASFRRNCCLVDVSMQKLYAGQTLFLFNPSNNSVIFTYFFIRGSCRLVGVVPEALVSSGAFGISSGGQSTTDFYGYVGVFVLVPDDSATAREVVPISSKFEIRNVQYVQLL
jgi:hypothetical protein